jgi:hypothetical protein
MRALLLIAAAVLSACASKGVEPISAPRVQADPAQITPVALGELRGSEALIFPDVDVPTAIAGAERYAAQCLRGYRRVSEPHGFALSDGAGQPYLQVMVASVSKSSALGLGGTGVTPDLKEAIAESVQGRLRCAS